MKTHPTQNHHQTKGVLEYSDFGEGSAILCLHGAMGGYDQSEVLAQMLGPKGFRYICVSRPGYLGSDLNLGCRAEEQAEAYAKLLDHLQIEKAWVMAVSGGGYSAQAFAYQFPERCCGLMLFSTTSCPVANKIPFSFKVMMFLSRWKWLIQKMRKAASKNMTANLKRSIQYPDILEQTINNAEVMPYLSFMLDSVFEKMHLRIAGTKNDILESQTYQPQLEKISIPVLVVHGKEDGVAPFDPHAMAMEQKLPQKTTLFIDRGEHVSIFTHHKMVKQAVKEFLSP